MGTQRNKRETAKRLAVSLKAAIRALEGNIRKLEKTGAHPLLIMARKKELAKMEEELSRLHR